jgi:hypothetical protein
MTLAELIQELAAATDGAAEVPGFRAAHPSFPTVTRTRVEYLKRYEKELEISQQEVLVENIGTPEEAAYYNRSRTPAVVASAAAEPVVPNATPEEIKANLDTIFTGRKYSDIQIQTGAESGIVTGVFYDTLNGEAAQEAYRIQKDGKDEFTAYLIKG